jgi:hypothetical protein
MKLISACCDLNVSPPKCMCWKQSSVQVLLEVWDLVRGL